MSRRQSRTEVWLDACRFVGTALAIALVIVAPLLLLAECTGSWVSERDSRQGRSQLVPTPTSNASVNITLTGTTVRVTS